MLRGRSSATLVRPVRDPDDYRTRIALNINPDLVPSPHLDHEHAGELGRAGDRRRPGDQPPNSNLTSVMWISSTGADGGFFGQAWTAGTECSRLTAAA